MGRTIIKEFLIDTDVLITHLRKPELVDSVLSSIIEEDSGCISIITEAELFAGKSTTTPVVADKVLKLIGIFEILPLTNELAIEAGKLRRDYGIALIDGVIAATAIHSKLKLLTCNRKDFERVPHLKLAEFQTS